MIDWRPIAEITAEIKAQEQVLLWLPTYRLWEIDFPPSMIVGTWQRYQEWTLYYVPQGCVSDDLPAEPTHFALINAP